ncbi:hypothetical protein BDF19DRAFT_433144 [Syncephalis fuscata]|nr:hypothetical protein BDF19DRAFT_433144 [Syncephalis fuscata]
MGGHGAYTSGPYGSFRVPHASRAHHWTSKLLGASMWFFMMYRAKQDGPTLLVSESSWSFYEYALIRTIRDGNTLGSTVTTTMKMPTRINKSINYG